MKSEDKQNGVSTPPPDSALVDQKQTAKAPEVSFEKATLEAISKFPFVGPWLVVIYTKWSWQGVILFAAGFAGGAIFMVSLFAFSAMPDWAVPAKYKNAKVDEGVKSTEQRITPHGDLAVIDTSDENALPKSLTDYNQYFVSTAAELSKTNPNVTSAVKIVKLKDSLPDNTTTFQWILNVRRDYTVETFRGFRVTTSGLIELLDNNGVDTRFQVPACNKGDTLVALLIMTRPKDAMENTTPLFLSFAP